MGTPPASRWLRRSSHPRVTHPRPSQLTSKAFPLLEALCSKEPLPKSSHLPPHSHLSSPTPPQLGPAADQGHPGTGSAAPQPFLTTCSSREKAMPCLVSIHLVALEEKLLPVGCVASLALLHGPGWGTALLNATGNAHGSLWIPTARHKDSCLHQGRGCSNA